MIGDSTQSILNELIEAINAIRTWPHAKDYELDGIAFHVEESKADRLVNEINSLGWLKVVGVVPMVDKYVQIIVSWR